MNIEKKYRKIDIISSGYVSLFFLIFLLSWYNFGLFNFFSNVGLILFLSNIFLLICFLPSILSKRINLSLFTLILLIMVLINSIFSNSGLGSIILIFNIAIMLIIFEFFNLSRKQIKLLSIIMFIYFLFYCFLKNESFNPNSIGYIILVTYIYSNFYLSTLKLKFIIIPVTTYFALNAIYYTESRGAFFGLVVFVLLSFLIPSRVWSRKVIILLLNALFTVGSIIFVYLYIYMWQNRIIFEFSLSKKPFFTGREAIWAELFYMFKQHPLVGIGSNYNIVSYGILNVHNSMFSILVIYGIPVFLLITILIWERLIKLSNAIVNQSFVKIAVSGFYSLLLVGFFETTLLWPATVFPTLFLIAIAYSSRSFYIDSHDEKISSPSEG